MWIAVFTAIVPVLAIPTAVIRAVVVAAAIVMAGIAYSLRRQPKNTSTAPRLPERDKPKSPDSPQPETETGITPNQSEKEPEAEPTEPKELTEEDLKRQFFNTSPKNEKSASKIENSGKDTKNQSSDKPINVTDPNSDRFVAVNTYKSRSQQLRK